MATKFGSLRPIKRESVGIVGVLDDFWVSRSFLALVGNCGCPGLDGRLSRPRNHEARKGERCVGGVWPGGFCSIGSESGQPAEGAIPRIGELWMSRSSQWILLIWNRIRAANGGGDTADRRIVGVPVLVDFRWVTAGIEGTRRGSRPACWKLWVSLSFQANCGCPG